MRGPLLAVVLVLALAALGCGAKVTADGVAEGETVCDSFCAAALDAGCRGWRDLHECTSSCGASLAKFNARGCGPEASDLFLCLSMHPQKSCGFDVEACREQANACGGCCDPGAP